MPTFIPRSIDEFQAFVFTQLALLNSPLNDSAPGSGFYTLTRAISATYAEQDLRLFDFTRSVLVSNATGEDLELHAADYNVFRRPGQAARGVVLARALSSVVTLPGNTVLTDPITTQQYILTSRESVQVSFISDTRLEVICTQQGEAGNAPAGTRLINVNFPQVRFVVGSVRTLAGVEGALSGGTDRELDDQLRLRLFRTILFRSSATPTAVITALEAEPLVVWADVTVPTPGVAAIWVDSPQRLSVSQLLQLRQKVEAQRPAGIVYTVAQVERFEFSLQLRVRPQPGTDLDSVTNMLRRQSLLYIASLRLGQPLIRARMVQSLMESVPVGSLEITQPITDLQPPNFTVLRATQVAITYI